MPTMLFEKLSEHGHPEGTTHVICTLQPGGMNTQPGPHTASSSIWPSQSLSTPSHTSGEGVPGVQASTTVWPLTQDVLPVSAQAPTPQVVGLEGTLSSICPLQSSSSPLQVSA